MITITEDPQRYIDAKRGLAHALARRFCKIKGSRQDDILGAAMLGLCCATDKIAKGEYVPVDQQNVDAYVAKTIIGHIKSFLENDFLIKTPRATYKKLMQEGKPVVGCVVESALRTRAQPSATQSDDDALEIASPLVRKDRNAEADRLVLTDLLLGMDLTEREVLILQYLRESFSGTEIGKKLGLTRAAISLNIKSIRKKYKQYWFLHKDDVLNPMEGDS